MQAWVTRALRAHAQSHDHEAGPMKRIAVFVGLDVHKDSISIAVARLGREEARQLAKIPNDSVRLLKKLDRLGARESISCCYEAGPTGYGLHRYLEDAGIESMVVAPTLIPVKSGDRVKTDMRDATKLAHFHRSGDLTSVWVPDRQTEALRDLVRARECAKADEIHFLFLTLIHVKILQYLFLGIYFLTANIILKLILLVLDHQFYNLLL